MEPKRSGPLPRDGDDLRLFALGRIQRCSRCDRYRGLRDDARGTPLAEVPAHCSYQVCAPLAARRESAPRHRLVVAQGGRGY